MPYSQVHGPTYRWNSAGFTSTPLDKTMAELCKELELHPTQINDWKRQLLERASDVFGGAAVPEPVDLAQLHAICWV